MEVDVLEDIEKETSTIELLSKTVDFKNAGIKREYEFSAGFKSKEDKDKRIIKGYASTTDKDRGDDIVTMEALTKSKDDLLEDGAKTVFYNHNKSIPIGKVINTELDGKGLIVEIQISKSKDVEDIWTKIEEGVLNSLSIGFQLKKLQIERDNKGNVIAFKLMEIKLYEVSVVGIPMNPKASIFSVAKKAFKGFQNRTKGLEMKTEDKKEEKSADNKTPIGVSKEEMDAAIVKAMTPLAEGMKAISDAVNSLVKKSTEAPPAPAEEKKEEKKEEKSGEVVPTYMKTLIDSINELKTAISKPPSRKGIAQDDDSEVDEKDEEVVKAKKCLTNIKDPNCVAYVKEVCNDMEAYDKLSAEEKALASNIYMSLMNAKKSKKSE